MKAKNARKTNRRLVDHVSDLMEIVEGVRGIRWACGGRRLVDTGEWFALYVAWKKELEGK